MRKIQLLMCISIIFQLNTNAQSYLDNLKVKLDTALFNGPSALYVEANSDVLIVDAYNHAIRKAKWDGNTETVIKTPAVSASDLFGIVDFTKDADGNIYVGDSPKGNIKKISPDGTITIIAGNGSAHNDPNVVIAQPTGIVYDKANNNLIVCQNWSHTIYRLALDGTLIRTIGNGLRGSTNGHISQAQFNYPKDVAIDAKGNIYVSEQGTHSIRKISTGDTVYTWAGGNAAGYTNGKRGITQFDNPDRLEFNPNGDLYVSELMSSRVRKIHGDRDSVSTFAADPAIETAPVKITAVIAGMAFIGEKDFVFTYQSKHGVYLAPFEYYNSYKEPVIYFGNTDKSGYHEGFSTSAFLAFQSVAVDKKGNIYLAPYNSNIYKIDTEGKFTNYSGSMYSSNYGVGTPDKSRYFAINSLSVDNSDNLLVGEDYYHDIRSIDVNGNCTRIAGRGLPPGQAAGQDIEADGFATDQQLLNPRTPLQINTGEVVFADVKIRKIKADGYLTSLSVNKDFTHRRNGPVAKTSVASVIKMVQVPDRDIYIAHAASPYITKFDGSNFKVITDTIAGYRDGDLDSARFTQPWDMTADPQGNVYVYDRGLDNIRKISTSGHVTTVIDFSSSNIRAGQREDQRVEANAPINIAYHPAGYLITSNLNGDGLTRIKLDESTTNLVDEIKSVTVNIFPNPNEGHFFIDSKEPVLKAELYTLDGKSEAHNSKEIGTKLSGLLLVKITTNSGVYTSKVFVK